MKSEKAEALARIMKSLTIEEFITYLNMRRQIISAMVAGSKTHTFHIVAKPTHRITMRNLFSVKGYKALLGNVDTLLISWEDDK